MLHEFMARWTTHCTNLVTSTLFCILLVWDTCLWFGQSLLVLIHGNPNYKHLRQQYAAEDGHLLFQHDNVTIHKAIYKVMCSSISLHRAMNSTPANTIGMNWNARSYHPKSAPDLSHTVVAGWEQLPAARSKIGWKTLLEKWTCILMSIILNKII